MIIGVDIGGTEIKAGIVSNNRILRKIKIKTGETKKEVIKNIFYSISSLINKRVRLIGVGCPGPADYSNGLVGATPNIPLKGVNIKDIISKRFKRKVIVNNDANCFVLGESIRLKKKNIVGLTVGTGVGGGIVIEGKLYVGKGNAGELGHCTINFDGTKSRCGNDGCLEEHVSSRAINRLYGREPVELERREWCNIGLLLGIGIANIANSFDPELVVIGCGISYAFNFFKEAMNKEVKKRALNKVKVIKGSEYSGILGAASLK